MYQSSWDKFTFSKQAELIICDSFTGKTLNQWLFILSRASLNSVSWMVSWLLSSFFQESPYVRMEGSCFSCLVQECGRGPHLAWVWSPAGQSSTGEDAVLGPKGLCLPSPTWPALSSEGHMAGQRCSPCCFLHSETGIVNEAHPLYLPVCVGKNQIFRRP